MPAPVEDMALDDDMEFIPPMAAPFEDMALEEDMEFNAHAAAYANAQR